MDRDDGFIGLLCGVCFSSLIFLLVWVNSTVVWKSPDNRYFIHTHDNWYELKSNNPVDAKTIGLSKETSTNPSYTKQGRTE